MIVAVYSEENQIFIQKGVEVRIDKPIPIIWVLGITTSTTQVCMNKTLFEASFISVVFIDLKNLEMGRKMLRTHIMGIDLSLDTYAFLD